jgi:hypothetical protein
MAHETRKLPLLICSLIIAASPLFGGVKLHVEEGRPVVDGVYVNGHGPYRFLVDTGTNVNLIETDLARKLGLKVSSAVEFASASRTTSTPQSDGNEVALEVAKAGDQRFLLTGLEAVHRLDPDIRGVLGQWFLVRFDYTLDLKAKRFEFGKQEPIGPRTSFTLVNGRLLVPTSLGGLVLDSGAGRLVLFGAESDRGTDSRVLTFNGSGATGLTSRKLEIAGRKVWQGDVITMRSQTEDGVAGLLPLNVFKSVYVSNSEGYVVFE